MTVPEAKPTASLAPSPVPQRKIDELFDRVNAHQLATADALAAPSPVPARQEDEFYRVPKAVLATIKRYELRGLEADYRTVSLMCVACRGVYPFHTDDCDALYERRYEYFKELLATAEVWKTRALNAEAALVPVPATRNENEHETTTHAEVLAGAPIVDARNLSRAAGDHRRGVDGAAADTVAPVPATVEKEHAEAEAVFQGREGAAGMRSRSDRGVVVAAAESGARVGAAESRDSSRRAMRPLHGAVSAEGESRNVPTLAAPAPAEPPTDALDLEPIKRRILVHDEEIDDGSEISYAEWEVNNDQMADRDVRALVAEVERLRAAALQEAPEAENYEQTVRSIAVMLGWMNLPPRRFIEADIAALKARARETQTFEAMLPPLHAKIAELKAALSAPRPPDQEER